MKPHRYQLNSSESISFFSDYMNNKLPDPLNTDQCKSENTLLFSIRMRRNSHLRFKKSGEIRRGIKPQ